MFSSSGLRALGLPVAVLMGLFGGSALPAQELTQEETAAVEEEVAAEEVAAEGEATVWPRLTFHGYLTQAYVQSDGHQFLGITEDGTADYRTAAVQIRADVSEDDAFVVQFSHERVGDSRLQALKEDVGLDWLFYERRFGASAVKVGRVQIPYGIYNEVRDVGTLLPFYRPSHNFYADGAFSSETLDGIVLSHRFQLGSDWGLETDAYFGDWKMIERTNTGYVEDDADDTLGLELWLDTPISGLRFGAGGMQYQLARLAGEEEWKSYHVSLSGEFARFSVQGEANFYETPTVDARIRWARLGFKVTEKIEINGQTDYLDLRLPNLPKIKQDEDLALGFNYFFRPDLVLKAEHHWNEGGFWLEDVPFFISTGIDTKFWILSLSTSF